MKTLMISVALVLVASQVTAETVTRIGPHGTSTTVYGQQNGVATVDGTWTGNNGAEYARETVCQNKRCETVWTLSDRKGRNSSGERDTIFGNGSSTTTAVTRGFKGKTRTRTINRTRRVTR